jgi:hypothetical protein
MNSCLSNQVSCFRIGRLAGFDNKGARALEHVFHLLDGENPAGELGQVAVVEKIRQQSTVARKQRVGGFEQIVEELLRRPSRRQTWNRSSM